ncbi:hypothetical protein GX586_03005 [bacterium]|nr:hypothetical protein [bacterium]
MDTNIRQQVRKGNIRYDLAFFQTGHEYVPPHVANGWLGGCFDEFGFMSKPEYGYDQGRRQFGYARHYSRCSNGGHNQASLLYMTAERRGGRPLGIGALSAYRQQLDLYTATLTTAWTDPSNYRIRAFASLALPELFELAFNCRLAAPDDALIVRIHFDTSAADNNSLKPWVDRTAPPALSFEQDGPLWLVRSATNCRETKLFVGGPGVVISHDGSDLVVTVPEGVSALRFLVADDALPPQMHTTAVSLLPRTTERFRKEHVKAAAAFWEKTGNVFLPAGPAAKIWLRTKYYLAAVFPTLPKHINAPTGLNGNIWRHGFPQDTYYLEENMPRLGIFDRALAQMAYWRDNLDAVKRYTRRLAGVDGAFYPWIPPFENWDAFEKDGPSNRDSYEFHNSAYVAAMVWNYHLITADRAFLEHHLPVLEEIARFYVALTKAGGTGTFVIDHPLTRSQDEATGHTDTVSQPLCCVWSALFAFRAYRDACAVLGVPGDARLLARIGDILSAGYDVSRLDRPHGILRTHAEDNRPLGQQKHPVQLNPIIFLPLPDYMEGFAPTRIAWERRYDLTTRAYEPLSCGWTFGAFTLASARMRSGSELARDLSMIQPARYADPLYIQFYETSSRVGWTHKGAYYFTTSGLYLQALTDAVAQDCRGMLDFFAALLPEWEHAVFSFSGLRMRGGITANGRWDHGSFEIVLMPARDVSLPVRVSRDVTGISLREHNGRVTTFDGQAEVPVAFFAGCPAVITFERRKPANHVAPRSLL